jgi:HAD superfamily hydrolase (TIGR01509 family)
LSVRPIDAIVFDFDGTILDTEAVEFESIQHVFAAHNSHITVHEWAPAIGAISGLDWPALLEQRTPLPVDRHAVRQQQRSRQRELMPLSRPRPGVLELMDAADQADVPMGIASNAPRRWVEHHTERLGIRSRFASILGVDDVTHGKPHPELYLASCSALGARPSRSVAIEDSSPGVQAAIAAGLFCVAVPTELTSHVVLHPDAHRLESLANVTYADLVRLVGQGNAS